MENTKKKGGAGLLITNLIVLAMLMLGSFSTYRGVGAILLSGPEHGYPVYFLLYKFLLGSLFVISTLLIGQKSDKKGIVIPFSIINMLIVLAAFLPVRRYYMQLRYAIFMFRHGFGAGLFSLLPYVFYALIAVFALLIMISAVKKNRKQPRGLCTLILVTTGVYALFSLLTLLFNNPYQMMKLRFVGLRYVTMSFRQIFSGHFNPVMLLNPFSNTAHVMFPFVTIAVFLAMFFAAKSIKPAEHAAEQAEAAYAYGSASTQDSGKSKVAAAVLAGVLGQFGVHRFYMKRIGSAVVQLLGGISFILGYALIIIAGLSYYPSMAMVVFGLVFLLFGIGTSIWAFVDFIRILCNRLLPAEGAWSGQQAQAPAPQPVYEAPQAAYQAPQQPRPAFSADAAERVNRELRQLDDMLARGLISREEYSNIRSRIENK